MNTLEVHSALGAGKQVADKLDTTESAKKLYSVLLALSFDTIEHKGYRAIPTHVTFHSSLTLIAALCSVDRVTAWRSVSRLKNLGVLDWRSHKTMFRGRASNSGTVFQVRLNPSAGTRAKLSFHDLKHQWHDMNRAGRSKTLAFQVMQHIEEIPAIEAKYLLLKQWTVKTYTQNPVIPYRLHGLETLLSVPHARGKQVAESIDSAAQALSQALQDSKSTDFYRKLLWALKRRLNASQEDHFHTLYLQADRIVKADMPEWKGLHSPGALLVSRLRKFLPFEVLFSP